MLSNIDPIFHAVQLKGASEWYDWENNFYMVAQSLHLGDYVTDKCDTKGSPLRKPWLTRPEEPDYESLVVPVPPMPKIPDILKHDLTDPANHHLLHQFLTPVASNTQRATRHSTASATVETEQSNETWTLLYQKVTIAKSRYEIAERAHDRALDVNRNSRSEARDQYRHLLDAWAKQQDSCNILRSWVYSTISRPAAELLRSDADLAQVPHILTQILNIDQNSLKMATDRKYNEIMKAMYSLSPDRDHFRWANDWFLGMSTCKERGHFSAQESSRWWHDLEPALKITMPSFPRLFVQFRHPSLGKVTLDEMRESIIASAPDEWVSMPLKTETTTNAVSNNKGSSVSGSANRRDLPEKLRAAMLRSREMFDGMDIAQVIDFGSGCVFCLKEHSGRTCPYLHHANRYAGWKPDHVYEERVQRARKNASGFLGRAYRAIMDTGGFQDSPMVKADVTNEF